VVAVFSVSTSGTEDVIYSFHPYGDGALPVAGLIYAKGNFWGTTELRGGDAGTVFKVSTTGEEKVVYSFAPYPPSSNGCNPESALINPNGTTYGTTAECGTYAGGSVLKYPHCCPGKPKLLHSFGNGSDGVSPAAALLNVNNTLYGITRSGGVYGDGTVFSINLATGAETVLHSFGYGSDGATPLAGVIDVKGTLYGTTSAGGAYGKGTVFALTP
jgi:uncharacterized repeat protein (TIGR03803 family)